MSKHLINEGKDKKGKNVPVVVATRLGGLYRGKGKFNGKEKKEKEQNSVLQTECIEENGHRAEDERVQEVETISVEKRQEEMPISILSGKNTLGSPSYNPLGQESLFKIRENERDNTLQDASQDG